MNKTYCASPWRGLHINPRGDVKTCCAGNPNMLGNLNSQTIEQILHGPGLKEIQDALRQGIMHEKYCYGCINRELKGIDTERSWHNQVNEDFDPANAPENFEFPTIIDVRWNTTCNLSCSYCDSSASSKWAAILKQPVVSDTRHYYEQVCDYIKKHYDQVREVALVGGEPLLLKENDRLLDVIPADCVVTIITNLSTDLESNSIFQKLAKRRNVGWSISFENVRDRFEYVRHGAKWTTFVNNLDLVQDLMRNNGHWGGIHAVYNLFTATRLCEIKQFAQERGLTIKWQNLYQPRPLDPRTYGSEVAELAAYEIERMYANFSIEQVDREFFDTVLAHYRNQNQPNPAALIQLDQFITRLETQHHPDQAGQFAVIWPELESLLWH
jgi:Radical SAM superfamily/Iron-sulfur cluster-binding domain/4Fe-4S single cluster domain